MTIAPHVDEVAQGPERRAVRTPNASHSLKAFIVTSAAQAKELQCRHWFNAHSTCLPPEIFWATATKPGKWKPYVICVTRDDSPIGLLYLKERILAGLSSKLLHGDASMRNMVDSSVSDHDAVLLTALCFAFSRKRALAASLYLPSDHIQHSKLTTLARSADLSLSFAVPPARHSRITLPDTYEGFLQRLGPHTRRNMRYYRRRFESAGHSYVEAVTLSEFRQITNALLDHSRLSAPLSSVLQAIGIIESAETPFIRALRSTTGEWLSVLAGWQEGRRATILIQMNNDLAYPHDSLSLVLRGYVLESLISSGSQLLDFWWGAMGLLGPHSEPFPTEHAILHSNHILWRLARRALTKLSRVNSRDSSQSLAWILCPCRVYPVSDQSPRCIG